MNKTFVAVLGASALLLAGCGREDKADDNHAQTCTDFAESQTKLLGSLMRADQTITRQQRNEVTASIIDSLDAAGLSATGPDIKSRIDTLVKAIPATPVNLVISKSTARSFNSNSTAVARACAAAGTSIDVEEIEIIQYMGP